MRRLKNILLLWFASLMAVGCDLTIHEYPDGEIAPAVVSFTLNMEFDTDMPLHATVEHKSRAGLEPEAFDVRYIINVYRDTNARQESRDIVKQIIVSKDDVYSLDHSVDLQLDEGSYRFIIWADYVDAGSIDHKYYNCEDFAGISLYSDEQGYISGSNDWRDAFVGRQSAEIRISAEENVVTVPMARPMAKYRFISTDLEEFITKMLALKAKAEAERRAQEAAARGESGDDTKGDDTKGNEDDTKVDTKLEIDLEDYYVVFFYPGWVNTAYNAYIDKSAWSSQGIRFRSDIQKISSTDAEIGFDYVIVNSSEDASKDVVSEVEVSLEIYQKAETPGEKDVKVGGVSKFFVPLVRSHLTEVRGKFLSSQADGAVGIIPGFDGEFTIPID